MFGGFGLQELLVILAIVLIIFGAGKLPQIGKNLGKGIKEFKEAIRDGGGEDNQEKKKQEEISNEKKS